MNGPFRLEGNTDWLLTGPEDCLDQIFSSLGDIGERLAPDLLLVNFGNAVGVRDIPYLGRVEVVCGKWAESDYEGMLEKLMSIASALPFAAEAATALPYDRSVVMQKDVLYHTFVYLRHILSEAAPRDSQLLPALRYILSAPHRQFERLSCTVSLEQATRLDPGRLIGAVCGRGPMLQVSDEVGARIPLAKLLGGQLPESIEETIVRSGVDTPENRFVKSFLLFALGVIEGMRRTLDHQRLSSVGAGRLRADCDAMERLLAPVRQHTLWAEVGPMVHFPTSSTVLQRKHGYRDVLRHYSKLRLGSRVPFRQETTDRLLEMKDIALLYEMWCYFAVVDGLTEILGRPIRAVGLRSGPMQVSVEWDYCVQWTNGTTLLYNASFGQTRSDSQHSYSVNLRPDITLCLPSRQLHLFDAKFRLERLDELLLQADDADPREDERGGTFKRGDLYKMHTYRDAIRSAESVWILYPGNQYQFFPMDGTENLNAVGLPPPATGVGAIPLMPGAENKELKDVLAALVGGLDLPR